MAATASSDLEAITDRRVELLRSLGPIAEEFVALASAESSLREGDAPRLRVPTVAQLEAERFVALAAGLGSVPFVR